MVTVKLANRMRMCLDCGAIGANLLTDENARVLRVCDECLRRGRWAESKLREREPTIHEVPTEFVGGQWVWPGEEEPDAVVTYVTEPSPETGHVGWVWWARGKMGDSHTYEDACRAAEASLKKSRP